MDKRNIESIYPLTKLQSAFLWRSFDAEKDPGQLQMQIGLTGNLDKEALSQAWKWLISHHPVLRTSIHWEGIKSPLQVVHRQSDFEICFYDGVQKETIEAPINLTQAPVLRVDVVSSDSKSHVMLLSCHHILLDGWSASILLQQLFEKYNRVVSGDLSNVSLSTPYQKWARYLDRLDNDKAKAFWTHELKGQATNTSYWDLGNHDNGFNAVSLQLGKDASNKINLLVRAAVSTPATLMQLVWGLALSLMKQENRVLFGLSVSGRSASFPGIESMLGLFANTLPLSLQFDSNESVSDILKRLQRQTGKWAEFESTSVADLFEWGCLSGKHPFDTLLVVENFPWDFDSDNDEELHISSFKGDITRHYPLTLTVIPSDDFELKLIYMESVLDRKSAAGVLELLRQILTEVILDPEITVGDLKALISTPKYVNFREEPSPNGTKPEISTKQYVDGHPRVRQALITIWQEILGIDGITVDQSFFDIGGNSFQGLRLIDRINKTFGKQLPFLALIQAPTISELAVVIEEDFIRVPNTRLIPVREEGNKPPFFLIYGEQLMAPILSNYLDDSPFYILDSHWERGDIEPNVTVEQLAADCIRDMRSVNPSGPWLIGGYSMGAVVAYEVAHQLKGAGEEVQLLLLIDPPTEEANFHPDSDYHVVEKLKDTKTSHPPSAFMDNRLGILGRIRQENKKLISLYTQHRTSGGLRNLKGVLRYRLTKMYKKRKRIIVAKIAYQFLSRGRLLPYYYRNQYAGVTYGKACKKYQLPAYNGELILFVNTNYPEPSIWDYLANKENIIHKFEGTHSEFTNSPDLIHEWSAKLSAILKDKNSRDSYS